jgi:iron complex outermembrane recepter protein
MGFRALLLATLIVPGAPALAQAAAPPAGQDAAEAVLDSGDTIIVTGTRRADRTVADSPVPIDVIGAEALRNSGSTETNRLLRDLVPSFNFPQPSVTDGTDVIRPASLRGLGPDQTLVLINGKRRHMSALLNINGSVGRGTQAVDINFIPAAALSRVEVLRDGAAAQYGSDAIAGVINFQLNDARSGARFSATYGGYVTSLSGVNEVTGLVLANGQPTLAPDGTLAVADSGKKERVNDGNVLTLSSNFGVPLGPEGFANVTVEYRDRDDTNRTGYDRRQQFDPVGGLFDAREQTFDRRSHRYGDPKTEDVAVFLNAGIPLDDRVEAYFFGGFGKRDGESAGFYRRSLDARNVLALYPEGFLPLITTESKDYAFTGGLRGEFGAWKWDLSMQYGENKVDYRIVNTLNASLGAASQDEFDAGGLTYTQWVNNLDVSRELDLLARSTLSLGLEYRRETYRVRAGEPDSYRSGGVTLNANNPNNASLLGAAPGSQVFPGFQPTIGGQSVTGTNARENVSAYAELDVDIIANWNVQLAGRYENYSDFGSDWNWKAASRFAITDWVAVRGAVSTGFRAPGVAQQFFAASATNNVIGIGLVDSVTLPVGNPVAQALGSSPLKPETAVNWSVGTVVTPGSGFTFSFDYYQIDIDDRIVLTESLLATRDALGNPSGTNPGRAIAQILNDAGFNTIAGARFFINGIDTRTRGYDAIATYRFDVGAEGRIGLTAGYNWNKTEITGRDDAPGALNQVPGVVLFGRLESLRIEEGQPRDKINLGFDYDQKWLGLTLRANRFGETLSPGSDAFNDLVLKAAWVVDAEVRVEPIPGLEVAFGANNVFDQYPTVNNTGRGTDPVTGLGRNYDSTNYFFPYSNFSPFGFNGRFVYGRVSYRF